MTEPLTPSIGWGVLHLFCRLPTTGGALDAVASPSGPGPERRGDGRFDPHRVLQAVKRAEADGVQVVTVAMLGHKADIGFMALAPDLWGLRRLQSDLERAGLEIAFSYVSLTEVSEYAAGLPDEMKQKRLYPTLPPEGMPAFCFYPMSKRRGDTVGSNWFSLPYEERKELMLGHGSVGRSFAGRIVQLITGSTGVDDWEWGVTLFGKGPDDLKDCVYTMRFDEGSARFAEFGPFLSGMVAPVETVLSAIAPDEP